VAGGLAAPLKTAFTQVCHLGEDVCRTAKALTLEEEDEPEALPEPAVAAAGDCASERGHGFGNRPTGLDFRPWLLPRPVFFNHESFRFSIP